MSNSRIETREIDDTELDGVAGGLTVSATVNDFNVTYTLGPVGVPALDDTTIALPPGLPMDAGVVSS